MLNTEMNKPANLDSPIEDPEVLGVFEVLEVLEACEDLEVEPFPLLSLGPSASGVKYPTAPSVRLDDYSGASSNDPCRSEERRVGKECQ